MGPGHVPPVDPSVRSAVRLWIRAPLVLFQEVIAALLPSPERERFARPREIDAPRGSLELGLVELAAGVVLFSRAGLAFMRAAASSQSMALIENWRPGLSTVHFQGVGLINWLAWFLHPGSWPFVYLAVVGLARCAAFAVSREAFGEPVVWAGLRAWQGIRRRRASRKREDLLGPVRPDRVLTGPGRDLFVISARDKPEWTSAATLEIDGRFYRLVGVEQRRDGNHEAVVYRLREEERGAVVRRLVRYEPPGPRDR